MPGISYSSYFLFSFVFVSHLKQLADFFQSGPIILQSHQHRVSVFQFLCIFIDTWCIVSAFSFSHSDRCLLVYNNGFNLLLPDGQWFWASSRADWPCVSYKVCIQSCSFLILLFSYYWLEGSLYIFWMQVLSEICIVNIFSQSVFCLFHFLRCLLKRILLRCIYIYTCTHMYIYTHLVYKTSNDLDVGCGVKESVQCPTLL